jgi:hypothetical protein
VAFLFEHWLCWLLDGAACLAAGLSAIEIKWYIDIDHKIYLPVKLLPK